MSKGLPGLPPPPPNADAATRQWMEAVSEALAVQVGQRGDPLDRAVTVRELGDGGVAQVQSVGKQAVVTAPPSGDLSTDPTLPVTPVNFEAHANPRSVVLTWSKHQQLNIAHAEVYRSATNVLEDAVLVGVSPGQSYADTDIATGQTWFYWLRYMSFAGNSGAWFSLQPVEAEVPALNGDEVVDLNVDRLVGNTAAFVEANINEGSITNAMIGNEIRSDGYVAGQKGWRFHKNGSAEIMNLYARGRIEGAHISGAIVEGSLFIGSSSSVYLATEADQGPNTTRFLCQADLPEYISTGGSSTRTGMLPIVPANYTAGGSSLLSQGTQQEEWVYNRFDRYRKFNISPVVKAYFGAGSSGTRTFVFTLYGVTTTGARVALDSVTVSRWMAAEIRQSSFIQTIHTKWGVCTYRQGSSSYEYDGTPHIPWDAPQQVFYGFSEMTFDFSGQKNIRYSGNYQGYEVGCNLEVKDFIVSDLLSRYV